MPPHWRPRAFPSARITDICPATDDWFVNKKVFGTSGYPWRCPLYKGDPDASFALPNAEAVTACHFTLKFHENCGEQEVADAFAALEKVEAAYLK